MIELLSPAGDFECLKAAVQNGANSVYFGANIFSARAFANNFDLENLDKAINYAKLRNVKTNLTLNTLIKEDEFEKAFYIAKEAYEMGIDAIIVQDVGLATTLIENFPKLDIHASTQMTIHNLDGVKEAQNIGFKRVVLSRELSIDEITNICKNTNIETEVFIHGALCMSYSGQCLFSSMIGGRSGNRGKCAQPCRLPYELLEENKKLDSGYLLSTRDLFGLEYLKQIIEAGVSCLKIEGRMKNPEYVATVTKIYRKYIDMFENNDKIEINDNDINDNDINDLLQVFNRGGFSSGHLSKKENRNLVYKEKQNNMGIYLGKILKYNQSKGHVLIKLENNIAIGDTISFEKENSKYNVSELMKKNQNIKIANKSDIVTLGRMKGNIHINDKVYKIASKELTKIAKESYSKENRKISIEFSIEIKQQKKIKCKIKCCIYNIEEEYEYDYIPQNANNIQITTEEVKKQLIKTNNTPFEITKINIELDNQIFIPISVLNDIRRNAIEKIENDIIKSFKKLSNANLEKAEYNIEKNYKEKNISLLINELNIEFDYTKLEKVENIYIPLKFWKKQYDNIIKILSQKAKIYIYLPPIIKNTNISSYKKWLNEVISKFNVAGIVISNISQINYIGNFDKEIIANYTLNIFNTVTIKKLKEMRVNRFTISPELNTESIKNICNNTNENTELIVYGKIPVMFTNYCFLGKTNKCYEKCSHQCSKKNKYYLKDRLGLKFRIIPDNSQTITTIYNSKIISILYENFNTDFIRIGISDEDINEINNIIKNIKIGKRLEGADYTNGNLNKDI